MSVDKQTLDELRIHRSTSPQRGKAPTVWKRLALLGVVLLLLSAAVWIAQRERAVPVTTAAVAESTAGTQRTLLNGSGYVTARRQATVSSKVTGKVVEVMLDEGMKVEAGQVLARLDPSNAENNLRLAEARAQAARASLDETQVQIDLANRELQRVSGLAANRIATPAELDRANTEVLAFRSRFTRQQAEVTVADREVAVWKQQLDDTIIRAPFAGMVTTKNAQPGEMISPVSAGGGFTRTGIGTLVDMRSLEIEVDVNESHINRVEPGQRVEATLDSYPDWRIPCQVIAIIPTAERQKATVKVRVGFDQLDPRILPEMGVKVAFHGAPGEAPSRSISVPASAVREVDGRRIVWVVREGRLERRAVTVGVSRAGDTEITAGLNSGERVVVQGPETLAEGARITEITR